MTGGDRKIMPQTGSIPRVASFARQVLGEVSVRPGQSKATRCDAFTAWLAETAASFGTYDQAAVLHALERARLTSDDLILQCIPQAANLLGARWTCNELGFAHVSLGSARLFGLCHTLGTEWSGALVGEGSLSLLLVTIANEDHRIGASVLAHRLRRDGHSVRTLSQATAEDLVALLDVGCFDGLMLSCSNIRSLASVAAIVKHIEERACVRVPIVLGGPVLHEVDGVKDRTGVTLATNDISAALDLIGRGVELPLARVAE